MQEVEVRSLVRELISYRSCGMAKNNVKTRSPRPPAEKNKTKTKRIEPRYLYQSDFTVGQIETQRD